MFINRWKYDFDNTEVCFGTYDLEYAALVTPTPSLLDGLSYVTFVYVPTQSHSYPVHNFYSEMYFNNNPTATEFVTYSVCTVNDIYFPTALTD
jgi:hypothetical protein